MLGDVQPEAQESDLPALRVLVPSVSHGSDGSLLEIIGSLNALNPSVLITATLSPNYASDLTAALASDEPPDVFLATGSLLPALVQDGLIAPLPEGTLSEGNVLQVAAQAISIGEVQHCFPHTIHTLALVYNPDRFAGADIDGPHSGWRWEDLAAAASELSNPDDGTVGLVLDPSPTAWFPFYLQAGGQIDQPPQAITDLDPDAARAAAKFFAKLYYEGHAATPASLEATWSGEAFADGKAAMTIAGDWILTYLADRPLAPPYATAELPAGPAGKANVAFANCLAVRAESANRDLSLQLAAQLSAAEVLPSWTAAGVDGLPVYADEELVAHEARPAMDSYLRALRYAQIWRMGPLSAALLDPFQEGAELLASGELAPEEFWPYVERNVGRAASP